MKFQILIQYLIIDNNLKIIYYINIKYKKQKLIFKINKK